MRSKAGRLAESDDYPLFCRGMLSDPYPLLHHLREQEPVDWSELLNAWVVTRYDDFVDLVWDPRLQSDRTAAYFAPLPAPVRRALHPAHAKLAGHYRSAQAYAAA